MNNNLYKRILKSVDNQVKSIINEQFNVNDIDFTDDSNDYDANIFNKEAIININKIYKKLLKNRKPCWFPQGFQHCGYVHKPPL